MKEFSAYVGESRPPGGIMILEEPESNLHPDAQRRLLSHLNLWAQDRLILVSTHSPVFLDRSEGAQVWLVNRERGISTVGPATSNLADVVQGLGVRLSDMLTAERALVVEGPIRLDGISPHIGTYVRSRRNLGHGDEPPAALVRRLSRRVGFPWGSGPLRAPSLWWATR